MDKGHVLYTDNYYTSPTLAKFLLSRNTHLVGTVRSNRYNYPAALIGENLQKGEGCFYVQNETAMIATKYRSHKDKASGKEKVVYMLSTCHQPEMEVVDAYSEEGRVVEKPTAIKSYNIHMGGVDRVDQQLHTLQCLRKSYKWYRKLAFRLVTQMVLNAYKIFIKSTNVNCTFMEYVIEVVKHLVVSRPALPQIQHQNDDVYRLTGRHFPSVKQAAEGAADQRPSKNCRVCYARGIRTNKGKPLKTVYICRSCPSEPGLHPDKCFELYHTSIDYGTNDD